MILRFKNVEAWRQAILRGVVPLEALGAPCLGWNYGATGKIADIDDSLFSKDPSGISLAGLTLLQSPPGSKPVALDGLWKLFGPMPSGSPGYSSTKSYLIRFSQSQDAEPVCRELLRLGGHGTLKHLAVEESYWIWASSLPYLTWLGLMDHRGVDVFEESTPGLWFPVGTAHPLAGILKMPSGIPLGDNKLPGGDRLAGNWRILPKSSGKEPGEVILSPATFQSLLESIQWSLPEVVHHEPASSNSPRWRIPLGLRTNDGLVGPPDLWVVDAGSLEGFQAWLARATPELRESFRYGVLGDNGPILLLRIRELPPSPGGEPPGISLVHQRSTPGLYLPVRSRLFPDPGPELTRKLLGMSPDRLVWLIPEGEKGFVPHAAPRTVLGPLETLVRFLIEREVQSLKTWSKTVEFAWEDIPLVEEVSEGNPGIAGNEGGTGSQSGPVPSQAVAPRKKGRPSRKTGPEKENPPPKPEPEKEKEPEPTRIEPQKASPKVPKPVPLPGPQASDALVEAFELAEGPWDSPARELLWSQMSAAWSKEGKRDWAALACLHELWKQHADWTDGIPEQAGLVGSGEAEAPDFLKAWHESLARKVGKSAHPALEELARDWPGEKAGVELQNWFMTGLALAKRPEAGTRLGLSTFQGIHDILLRDCPDSPVRLHWFAWLSLGRLFGNPTAALGGGERLLVRVLEEGIRPAMEWPRPLVAKSQQDSPGRGAGSGLGKAFQAVMDWFTTQGISADTCQTLSIAQWTFAYGFARMGDGEKARELGEIAQRNLSRESLGSLLSRAYAYRVSQAILGAQASGPLESPWLREAVSLGKWSTFALDYLRETSRILEPHQAVRAFPAGDPLSRVLDPLGHPGALGRLCRESAPASPGQADAQARWAAILDRILLVPAADAGPLLEGAEAYLLAVAKPGAISMRMGARLLAGGAFFQISNPEILEWMMRGISRPPVVGGWLGGKSPGMDKGFFQFITRQIPLLVQLGERAMARAILGALEQGVDGLESCESKSHARFLLDCAGNTFLENPAQNLSSLTTRIRAEVQGLQNYNQQRNEPWQALCHKLVAYIQALGAAPGAQYREQLVAIPQWIQPIRDHFATAPKARETGSRLCYQRHQVEWIEALVLAICEASPLRVPEWVIADEKQIRVRIRKDLAQLEKIHPMPLTYSPGSPRP